MTGGDGSGRTDRDPRIAGMAAELRAAAERDFEQVGKPAMAKIPKRVAKAAADKKAAEAAPAKPAKTKRGRGK